METTHTGSELNVICRGNFFHKALHRDQVQLEKLFLSYVPERIGPGRWLAFVHGWAKMRDAPQTMTSIALRALLSVYFFILVAMARGFVRRSGLKTGTIHDSRI